MLKQLKSRDLDLINKRILDHSMTWKDTDENSSKQYKNFREWHYQLYESIAKRKLISTLDDSDDGFYLFHINDFIWIFNSNIILPYEMMVQGECKNNYGFSDSLKSIKIYAEKLESLKNKEYAIVVRDMRCPTWGDWYSPMENEILLSKSEILDPKFAFRILVLSDL